MANSFTVTKESVFGDLRVRIGTLLLADGGMDGSGASVPSGLNYVYFMGFTSSAMTRATLNCTANGNVNVTSGASGISYNVMILGQ
jgi:hypothetical protein